jgi:hypothetical protein
MGVPRLAVPGYLDHMPLSGQGQSAPVLNREGKLHRKTKQAPRELERGLPVTFAIPR